MQRSIRWRLIRPLLGAALALCSTTVLAQGAGFYSRGERGRDRHALAISVQKNVILVFYRGHW